MWQSRSGKRILGLLLLLGYFGTVHAAELPRILFAGQEVLGNTYTNFGSGNVTMTGYSGGRMYYTLDGTEPSILSPRYLTPIAISSSGRFRAVAYNSDFSESSTRDVAITILPLYYLRVSGATSLMDVSVEGKPFARASSFGDAIVLVGSNQLVTVRPVEAQGWFFSSWKGLHASLEPTNSFRVQHSHEIRLEMFRTNRLEATYANGTVEASPPPPYYSSTNRVQLTAVPKPGFTFVSWSPFDFTVISLYQDASSAAPTPLFAPLPNNTFNLQARAEGFGYVNAGRYAYAPGEVAFVDAVPLDGYRFTHWSGDASGKTRQLFLNMDGDKSLVAHFERVVAWQTSFGDYSSAPAVGPNQKIYFKAAFGDQTTLRILDPNGIQELEHLLGNRSIYDEFPVMIGADGTLYVTTSGQQLNVFSPAGRLLWSKNFGSTINLALGDDSIYVSHPGGVHRVGFDGTTLRSLIHPEKSYHVKVDALGHLRLNGSSIASYTKNLDLIWDRPEESAESTLDLEGNLYVAVHPTHDYTAINAVGESIWSQARPSVWQLALGTQQLLFLEVGKTHSAVNKNGVQAWKVSDPWAGFTPMTAVAGADGSFFIISQNPTGGTKAFYKANADGTTAWDTLLTRTAPVTHPVLTENGMVYIGGAGITAFNYGVGPAASGWPMARADARNTSRVFTGSYPQPQINSLRIRVDGAYLKLTFLPQESSPLILQSSTDLMTWEAATHFTGELDYSVARDSMTEPRFYRVVRE